MVTGAGSREIARVEQDLVAESSGAPMRLQRATNAVAILVLGGLILRLTIRASEPLSNGDTWFHLRIGHEFWGRWPLAHPRGLTTFATSPWVPTQWSTEMLAAKVEDWFGLPGVAWLSGVGVVAFVVAVYLVCRRRADALVSVVVTGLVVISASPQLSARPQVVSLIFLVVTVEAWLRTAEDGQPRWGLIPLTWIWATAHGFWTVGLAVAGLAVLGIAVDKALRRRRILLLLAVPAASLIAGCLTPTGPRLLLTQFAVASRSALISEWGPTSFRTPGAIAAALLLAVLIVLWARGGRVAWIELLFMLLAAGLIALVQRMVPLGAIVVAPLVSASLCRAIPDRADLLVGKRREYLFISCVSVLCVAGLAAAVPHTAATAGGVPHQFEGRLAALPSGAPVLLEDGTGAWVEWRFPKLNPVIDGMLDAYPVSYIRRFEEYRKLEPGWKSFVAGSHADVAVLKTGSPLSAAMRAELHWRQVQRDGDWVYLVAPGSAS